MSNLLEHASKQKFRGYVQRVAFQLTLSEPMIRMLRLIRDYPAHTSKLTNEQRKNQYNHFNMKDGYVADLFIKEITALEKRGLAYHNPSPKNNPWPEGWVFYKLTRAGELTCNLLEEAGLIQPKLEVSKRKKAA